MYGASSLHIVAQLAAVCIIELISGYILSTYPCGYVCSLIGCLLSNYLIFRELYIMSILMNDMIKRSSLTYVIFMFIYTLIVRFLGLQVQATYRCIVSVL